jgi:hypothetical protein
VERKIWLEKFRLENLSSRFQTWNLRLKNAHSTTQPQEHRLEKFGLEKFGLEKLQSRFRLTSAG